MDKKKRGEGEFNRLFNEMVDSMCAMAEEDRLLDEIMNLDEEAVRRVPLRYRLIALGFVKQFTLEQLNEKLIKEGCHKLYSRNFWEASLIYAFKNGYSYDRWREIQQACADILTRRKGPEWFGDEKITYSELERYVLENSDTQGAIPKTGMLSQYLENGLIALDGSVDSLKAFMETNIDAFSAIREKTRYYFCKYLYYNLKQRIDSYLNACRRGNAFDEEETLAELTPIKAVTWLKRHPNAPEEEKIRHIREAGISAGVIFDEFNYFYFGYISVDWAGILLDFYENVTDLPGRLKKDLAALFRRNRPEWRKLADEEVILAKMEETEKEMDAAYDMDGNRGYGKNRTGERAVYQYISGRLDIERTVLISFLMFFAYNVKLPEEYVLTPERMTEILVNCGYAGLDTEDDIDWLVTEFLTVKDPKDFLYKVLVGYAEHKENSFFYHVYGNAKNYEEELARVMLPQNRTSEEEDA